MSTTPDYAGLSRRLGALAYHIQQTGTADGQDAQTCLEVAEALRTLLERERDQLRDKLHCMCGSPIDHSAWEGHTPVSVYDYSLDQERSRAEAAEAQLAEARKALEPFAEAAGEYFAQNFDAENSLASIRRSDGYRYHIKAGHLFAARRAREGGKVDG